MKHVDITIKRLENEFGYYVVRVEDGDKLIALNVFGTADGANDARSLLLWTLQSLGYQGNVRFADE